MIKVSVIVPVYNTEKYLKKCLESLVKQSLKEIEIIIVNDGSPDQSEDIINRYQKEYPEKIKAFKKVNGGLSSARNMGIDKAGGEYLAFVDSDDYVKTQMFEKMYAKAKEEDLDLVMCDFIEEHTNKSVKCSCHLNQSMTGIEPIKEHMVILYPSAWNKIYRRELFDHIRFKPDVWFEDVEMIYRLWPKLKSVGAVNEYLYHYVIREGSITKTVDKRIYDYIDNMNGLIKYYQQEGLYDHYRDELEYVYVRYLYATFVKTAAKYERNEYLKAVDRAIGEVKEHYPNYRDNKYMDNCSLKNIYFKLFNRRLALIYYLLKH